jgi:hypothetical protein
MSSFERDCPQAKELEEENDEILADAEERKRIRDATTKEQKRAERARITNRVYTYDPDTPNDGTNTNPNINAIIKELIDEQLRLRRISND